MGDELDGMSDVAGELEQLRQQCGKDILRARLEGRKEALELAHKGTSTTLLKVLRELERLSNVLPAADDSCSPVRHAYKSSMRVVSQTFLGVEPEEIIDDAPPPPNEETKNQVGKSLRELAKSTKVPMPGYGNPAWFKALPVITAIEQRLSCLKEMGVNQEAANALREVSSKLGVCTRHSQQKWFFNLTSHVIRELLWLQQGINVPEEMTDNEGPHGS